MNRNAKKAGVQRGFTLIEVLVVVGIIAILLGVLIPSLAYAKRVAARAASQTFITSLAQALEAYKTELGMYPPSSNESVSSGAYAGLSGSHFLSQALMGWMPGSSDGAGPDTSDGLFGFRVTPNGRGKVYGPYMSAAAKNYDTSGGRPAFLDDGNAILYYRAVPAAINGQARKIDRIFGTFGTGTPMTQAFTGIFVKGDNLVSGRDPEVTSDKEAIAFRRVLGKSDGTNMLMGGESIVGQDSFLLVSPGWDGEYFTADDVVNRN